MKWFGAIVLALGSIGIAADAQTPVRPAPRTELMIITGPENAVNYQLGRDVKRLLEEVVPEAGIDLSVLPSLGALQNVIDVFRYASIQLGVTQSDVLSYLEIYARGDPDARRIIGGLQIVGGLYDEDVHLVARPGIKSIADLAGKRVDMGPPGSGTVVTSLVLLHLAGAEPSEMVNFMTVYDSITALRKGRIDAFFRVAAAPAEYLREGVSVSHGFVLVPIRLQQKSGEAALVEHYKPTVIPANTYPWVDHPVDTVKIRTAVVTSGAPTGSATCDAIARLVRVIGENRAWLEQNGHVQWKEFGRNRADILADPRVSPCAVQAYR